MKTLLIDNYDSFTFNLMPLIAAATGEAPTVVRNDAGWSDLRPREFDAIVLSPGPGRPDSLRDFGICRQVILEAGRPLLGICLGHQGLAHAFGAQIAHAPEPVHGRTSAILHRGDGLFAGLPQGFSAVRYHSLLVSPSALPDCLEQTAWTREGLVMALRHRDLPLWGVQFHPESIGTEHGERLISNFFDLAGGVAGGRRGGRSTRAPSRLPEPSPERTAPGVVRPAKGVHARELPGWIASEPEQAFLALERAFGVAFWLDSSRIDPSRGRWSYLGLRGGPEAFEVSYRVDGTRLELHRGGQIDRRTQSLFTFLARELELRAACSPSLPFDFNGGFAGYLGYGLKAECGGLPDAQPPGAPDAQLVFADRLLCLDHLDRRAWLISIGREAEALRWFDQVAAELDRRVAPHAVPARPPPEEIALLPSRAAQGYLEDIRTCLEQIREGNSYELCLTRQERARADVDPIALYLELRRVNPAPYSALLRFGPLVVACSSPESFLKVDREGWVEAKPIKGTAARGGTPLQDAERREGLRASEKDRAENLMIVDLMRNDLGRVCEVGSVHVPKQMDVETFATVHQLVSTIRGKLRASTTALDCFRASFPPGSMTGAPKLRSMELLDRLEPVPRGIYSGAIGFFALNGTADLNVVIRTLVVEPGQVSLGVGGAITALSQPEAELEETRLKAEALVRALRSSSRRPSPGSPSARSSRSER